MTRVYYRPAASCDKGHEGLRGQGGPVGTSGRGGYRVPCSYVTDMKPKYITIYTSIHNFKNICNGFVTATACVTDLIKQYIALPGWGNKFEQSHALSAVS